MIDEVIFFDRAMYNQGVNAKYDPQILTDGTASTLVARGPGGSAREYVPYRIVVGTLAASDYKWVQQQQVMEGKLIVERLY